MERARLCDRPGCGAPAAASLTFDYSARQVWLDDLDEPHPTRFELCGRHAGRVGVPVGWVFHDRRMTDDVAGAGVRPGGQQVATAVPPSEMALSDPEPEDMETGTQPLVASRVY